MKYLNAILCPTNAFLLCHNIEAKDSIFIALSAFATALTLFATVAVLSQKD